MGNVEAATQATATHDAATQNAAAGVGRSLHLVTGAIGTIATFALEGRILERIPIASDDLAKRVLRLRCATFDIGLRLGLDAHVRDGDVVYADDERAVALCVAADEVLVCRPASVAQALAVAHAIGNRHWPMQLDGDALVIRDDRLARELLESLGAPFEPEIRTLAHSFRHANAPHSHEEVRGE
jgi:urease accessory protein